MKKKSPSQKASKRYNNQFQHLNVLISHSSYLCSRYLMSLRIIIFYPVCFESVTSKEGRKISLWVRGNSSQKYLMWRMVTSTYYQNMRKLTYVTSAYQYFTWMVGVRTYWKGRSFLRLPPGLTSCILKFGSQSLAETDEDFSWNFHSGNVTFVFHECGICHNWYFVSVHWLENYHHTLCYDNLLFAREWSIKNLFQHTTRLWCLL